MSGGTPPPRRAASLQPRGGTERAPAPQAADPGASQTVHVAVAVPGRARAVAAAGAAGAAAGGAGVKAAAARLACGGSPLTASQHQLPGGAARVRGSAGGGSPAPRPGARAVGARAVLGADADAVVAGARRARRASTGAGEPGAESWPGGCGGGGSLEALLAAERERLRLRALKLPGRELAYPASTLAHAGGSAVAAPVALQAPRTLSGGGCGRGSPRGVGYLDLLTLRQQSSAATSASGGAVSGGGGGDGGVSRVMAALQRLARDSSSNGGSGGGSRPASADGSAAVEAGGGSHASSAAGGVRAPPAAGGAGPLQQHLRQQAAPAGTAAVAAAAAAVRQAAQQAAAAEALLARNREHLAERFAGLGLGAAPHLGAAAPEPNPLFQPMQQQLAHLQQQRSAGGPASCPGLEPGRHVAAAAARTCRSSAGGAGAAAAGAASHGAVAVAGAALARSPFAGHRRPSAESGSDASQRPSSGGGAPPLPGGLSAASSLAAASRQPSFLIGTRPLSDEPEDDGTSARRGAAVVAGAGDGAGPCRRCSRSASDNESEDAAQARMAQQAAAQAFLTFAREPGGGSQQLAVQRCIDSDSDVSELSSSLERGCSSSSDSDSSDEHAAGGGAAFVARRRLAGGRAALDSSSTSISTEGRSSSGGGSSSGHELEDRAAPPAGCVGLINLGNTCYANSVLQCLNCLPEFVSALLGPCALPGAPHGPVAWSADATVAPALRSLLEEIWGAAQPGCGQPPSLCGSSGGRRRAATVSPRRLLRAMAAVDDRWADGCQQDGQEFLHSLLERLQSEANRVRGKPVFRALSGKGSEAEQAAEAAAAARAACDSLVDDLFGGLSQSSIACAACKHTSHTFEPFVELLLPLPPGRDSVSLEDCLAAFAEPELLTGAEAFKCDACGTRGDATKRLRVWAPPRLLVLSLKRFSDGGSAGGAPRWAGLGLGGAGGSGFGSLTKNDTPVRVDAARPLDLAPFVSPAALAAGAARGAAPLRYELAAVSQHAGCLGGGHYEAVGRAARGGWRRFNDSAVSAERAPAGASAAHYVLDVCALVRPDYWTLREVALFLTSPGALPPDQALGLYLRVAGGDWLYRGAVHAGHPSEAMPLQLPGPEGAGGAPAPPAAPGAVQLGVSLEPLAALAAKEGSRVGDRLAYGRRVGLDLFRFLESFATTGGAAAAAAAAPGGDAIVIPTRALDAWLTRFERKFRLDPDFLTRQDEKF
ncbi:Usp2 [Scenedesmus sp. PABB004]|nr:Usp2 [Scenedesmus sp. PABB004]